MIRMPGQIKKSGYLSNDIAVLVDLSAEGMGRYRNTIQQNTPKQDEGVKQCCILASHDMRLSAQITNHNMELSARINEINAEKGGKGNLTVKDRADSILEAYASLYAEIVQGYDEGTRCVYGESVEGRTLTKEEDLARLKEAYKDHAKTFEEHYLLEQENQKILEKSIRETAWGKYSSKAREYLQEAEKKREDPEYIPPDIRERILDAGKAFLSKVSYLKSMDRKSIMALISSINVW